jgi:hypothetical protein
MDVVFEPYKKRKRKSKGSRMGFAKRMNLKYAENPKALRERLDVLFAAYIRKRDNKCLMGEMWGKCNGPIQAGHLISRRHLATRWDEENVYGQCRSHNYQHTFNPNLYISWYVKKYGSDQYENLIRRSREVFRPTKGFLLEKIQYFEERLRLLG